MPYLLRYAEIALKGKNRKDFENLLVKNIRLCLKRQGTTDPRFVHVKGRIILYCQEGIDLRTVFGLSSYSFATESELDDDSLFVAADLLTQGWGADTKFRVTTKRIEKDTLETSQEINIKLGSHVVEKKGCKVSLKGFDKELTVEIMRGKAFLFDTEVRCFGGLPVGIQGRVLVRMQDQDSSLAAILMMRRGCEVICFSEGPFDLTSVNRYFHKFPLQVKILSEEGGLKALSDRFECHAIVSSAKAGDITEEASFSLYPLVGYDEAELAALREAYL